MDPGHRGGTHRQVGVPCEDTVKQKAKFSIFLGIGNHKGVFYPLEPISNNLSATIGGRRKTERILGVDGNKGKFARRKSEKKTWR